MTTSRQLQQQQERPLLFFTFFRRGHPFTFSTETVLDCIVTGCTVLIEKAVLLLGPLLIAFASVIIAGLSWTFFTIMVPMMQRYYQQQQQQQQQDQQHYSSWYGTLMIGAHIALVLLLLMEIIFNYFMCVTTRNNHKGIAYQNVVRELAEVTGFIYPETPQEVIQFRHDFNDKMMIRMRRRQQQQQQQQQQPQQTQQQQTQHILAVEEGRIHNDSVVSGATVAMPSTPRNGLSMTLDHGLSTTTKTTTINSTLTDNPAITQRKTKSQTCKTKSPPPQQQRSSPISSSSSTSPTVVVRNWMFMAPDEWGFCTRSNQPKPPRSHYDHVSKTLVLCLDHYCPWMFNAIGYFNYRYFCNFLFFVELAMIYGATI
jgi:hypothetical protein